MSVLICSSTTVSGGYSDVASGMCVNERLSLGLVVCSSLRGCCSNEACRLWAGADPMKPTGSTSYLLKIWSIAKRGVCSPLGHISSNRYSTVAGGYQCSAHG